MSTTLPRPAADDDTDDGSIPFVHHFISGARTLTAVDRWGPVFNPSTGAQTAGVPFASVGGVDAAVRDAQRAFADWSALTPLRRARVMFRFRELIEAHTDELAELIRSDKWLELVEPYGFTEAERPDPEITAEQLCQG